MLPFPCLWWCTERLDIRQETITFHHISSQQHLVEVWADYWNIWIGWPTVLSSHPDYVLFRAPFPSVSHYVYAVLFPEVGLTKCLMHIYQLLKFKYLRFVLHSSNHNSVLLSLTNLVVLFFTLGAKDNESCQASWTGFLRPNTRLV